MAKFMLNPSSHGTRRVGRARRLGGALAWMAAVVAVAPKLSADETGIYVIRVDGGEERKVVAVDTMASHGTPRWSHDGKRLVFDAFNDEAGNRKLFFVVNIDGTGLRKLGEHGVADWSPDDKQLVYRNFDAAGQEFVWVVNVDGQGREQLVAGSWPRWSPDGSKIAFCQSQTIKLLDLAGGDEQLLVDETFVQTPGAFEWSRDGKRLAFVAQRQGVLARELFVVGTASTSPVDRPRLAREGNFGSHVSWSADDKQLAITIDSFIYLVDVEGQADPKKLAGQRDRSRDPAWSPDVKWIAFARRPR
jgi:Tol biopolymer transport system component